MGMLDASVSANPIRVDSQRGVGGVQPNISVSREYIEDLINNKMPRMTSSPQDPGRFARRKLDPTARNVAAEVPAQPTAPTDVRVQGQQPRIEDLEVAEVAAPPIVTSPKYSKLDLLLVLAPHLADPELERAVLAAHEEETAINGGAIHARG